MGTFFTIKQKSVEDGLGQAIKYLAEKLFHWWGTPQNEAEANGSS